MAGLRIERDDGVLRVTLAKPERRNAFDAALIAELNETFSDVGDARVVVLAGDGPSFCAGADVEWQRSSIDLSFEENVEDALRLFRMMDAVDSCPAPVPIFANTKGEMTAGMIPSRTSVKPNVASGCATAMSEHTTRPEPPPSA